MKFEKIITSTTAALSTVVLSGCFITGGTKGITPLPAPNYSTEVTKGAKTVSQAATVTVSTRGQGLNQKQAVDNAVDNAVKEVVSTLVSALNKYTGDSSIDNAMKTMLTEQVVLSSQKLVTKHSITTPWSESDQSVNVKTEVSTSALLKNKIILDLLKSKLEYPKFAILVKNNAGQAKMNLAAHNMISQRFSKHGFEFVPGTISASYMNMVGKVATTELADTIYNKTGAQYVIIGNLNKSVPAKTNAGESVQVDLDVEVIDGRNRTLLTSISESQTGTGHSAMSAEKSGLKKVLDRAFLKNNIEQDIYNVWLDSLSRFEKTLNDEF